LVSSLRLSTIIETFIFAYFPQPSDDWVNSFYANQGVKDPENSEARIMFATSKVMNVSAQIMIDFVLSAEEDGKKFKSLVDFGLGSGGMALKLTSLYCGKVTAVDF